MCVSRAPRLSISPDAPWAVGLRKHTSEVNSDHTFGHRTSNGNDTAINISLLSDHILKHSVIDQLKRGTDTKGRVILDCSTSWSASKDAFYVLISRDGVHKGYTMWRLFSKLVFVCAFVVSTAMFSSTTLLQLQPAIIVMALVLCAGIFG
jgi:hypothetical protein